jgi:hypothetical protein
MPGTELITLATAKRAMATDLNRMHPQPGELLVTIPAHGDDRDPHFPALVTRGRWPTPHFRREVAEAVVVWTNEVYREDPANSPRAYWRRDTVVIDDGADELCFSVEDDGRFSIGGGFWVWDVWHPDQEKYHAALNSFADTDPRLEIWRRYPNVTSGEDQEIDTYACEQVSKAFAQHAAAHGLRVWCVQADGACTPFIGEHWWTVVLVGDEVRHVDWTARQFHNLECPPNPQHANIPFPLLWASSWRHLVAGRFASILTTPVTAEEHTHGQ